MSKTIPSAAEVAKKWSDVTPGRKAFYLDGVNKTRDWAGPTAEAEDRFEAGIAEAISDKRFGKGVVKVGTAGWKEPTLKKGGRNWGPGVRDAGAKYQKNFEPYLNEIKVLKENEPPKYPKGSPENLKRVEHFAVGLRKKKLMM